MSFLLVRRFNVTINCDKKRKNDVISFFPTNSLYLKINELRKIYETIGLVMLYENVTFKSKKRFNVSTQTFHI